MRVHPCLVTSYACTMTTTVPSSHPAEVVLPIGFSVVFALRLSTRVPGLQEALRGDPRSFFYWTRYGMGFMAGGIIHERHIFSINNNNGRHMAHGYD